MRGDSVEVRSDDRGVRSATVTWSAGVTSRIPRWTRQTLVAAYVVVDENDRRTTGNLWASASDKRRATVGLRARSGDDVRVDLRAGRRPRLAITKLPAGTRSIEVNTIGAGRDVLRFTSACRHQRKRQKSTIVARLGDGSRQTVTRTNSNSCGDGVPLED